MTKQSTNIGLSQFFFKKFCAMTQFVGLVGDFDLVVDRENQCITYSFDVHIRPGTAAFVSQEVQKMIDELKKDRPEIVGFSATSEPGKGIEDSFTVTGFIRNWWRTMRGLPKIRCEVFKVEFHVLNHMSRAKRIYDQKRVA